MLGQAIVSCTEYIENDAIASISDFVLPNEINGRHHAALHRYHVDVSCGGFNHTGHTEYMRRTSSL